MGNNHDPGRPESEAGRAAEWRVFALLLALATVLRLYGLGSEGLWIDEVLTVTRIHESMAAEFGDFWSLRGSGRPLASLPVFLAAKVGDSEFALRLPYALLGIAEVAVVYLVARRICGVGTARLAMLFMALSPLHVWYSQEVRRYVLWSFFTTLSFLALAAARDEDGRAAWVGYLAATVAGLHTFVLSIVVIVCQALTAWGHAALGGGRRFLARQHSLALIAVVVSLPVLGFALGATPATGGAMVGTERARSIGELPYLFFAYSVGFSLGPTLGELHRTLDLGWILSAFPGTILLAALSVSGVLAAAMWRLREDTRAAVLLVPWALGVPFLVYASTVFTGQTFNVRYALAGLPGFLILLAVGANSSSRRWVRGVAGGSIVVLFGLSLASYYWDDRYDKEHVREAMASIGRSEHADAPVAFVGQGSETADYYGPDQTVFPVTCDETQGTPFTPVDSLRNEPIVWLIAARDWPNDQRKCRASLERSHRVVERMEFIGVTLVLFERGPIPADNR